MCEHRTPIHRRSLDNTPNALSVTASVGSLCDAVTSADGPAAIIGRGAPSAATANIVVRESVNRAVGRCLALAILC